MERTQTYSHLHLTLNEGKIAGIKDASLGSELNSFHAGISTKGICKLYVIKDRFDFLYVGTTTGPIGSRLKSGLSANGSYGYHGYKWKHHDLVSLYTWCFEEFNKLQVEAIEAELAYLIRSKTGVWPRFQNEIHFNNEFKEAKYHARQIFSALFEPGKALTVSQLEHVYALFSIKPESWGLRGDSQLWDDLFLYFKSIGLPPNKEEFQHNLVNQYIHIVGEPPVAGKQYYVTEYDAGGISSGQISCDFWINDGFPLLIARFTKLT